MHSGVQSHQPEPDITDVAVLCTQEDIKQSDRHAGHEQPLPNGVQGDLKEGT